MFDTVGLVMGKEHLGTLLIMYRVFPEDYGRLLALSQAQYISHFDGKLKHVNMEMRFFNHMQIQSLEIP